MNRDITAINDTVSNLLGTITHNYELLAVLTNYCELLLNAETEATAKAHQLQPVHGLMCDMAQSLHNACDKLTPVIY